MTQENREDTGGVSSTGVLAMGMPIVVKFFILPFVVFEILLIPTLYQFSDQNYKLVALASFTVLVVLAMLLAYLLLKMGPKTTSEGGKSIPELIVPAPTEVEKDGTLVRIDYEIFVSTAMASLDGDPEKFANRAKEINNIVEKIRELQPDPVLRVFCATLKVTAIDEFEDPAVALKWVVLRMRVSKYLAFICFESVPTSALMEVGMALSLGKPNIWFIKKGVPVPYLMKGTNYLEGSGLPPVRTVEFADETDLKRLISVHGKEYFGLDGR